MSHQPEGSLEEVNYSMLFTVSPKMTSCLSASENHQTRTSIYLKILPISTKICNIYNTMHIFIHRIKSKILRRLKNWFIEVGTNYLKSFLQTVFGSMHILVLLFFKMKIVHEWKHPGTKCNTPLSSHPGPAFRANCENISLCDLPRCAKTLYFFTLCIFFFL